MGSKLLLSLLCVMLVVILVFNAFAISYSKTDFMSTMLTVESTIGDFAGTVNGFFNNGLLTSLFDMISTIMKTLERIEEKINLLEKTSSLFKTTFQSVKYVINSISASFEYIKEKGFSFTNNESWRNGYRMVLDCCRNEDFYNDDGTLNYDDIFALVDAMYYGEENKFSSLIDQLKNENCFDYVDRLPANTFVIGDKISFFSSVTIDNADYWFTTIDISVPDTYCPEFNTRERILGYLNCVLPIYDSNMFIEYNSQKCYLTSFKISSEFDRVPSLHQLIIDSEFFYITLCFTYYDDVGKTHSKWVPLSEFIDDKSGFFTFVKNVSVYDSVLTRDDSVYN